MTFVRKSADLSPIKDTVFAVAALAAKDKQENGDLVIDATIGSLFYEDGSFVVFHSVFDHYDEIDHSVKGAYASSFRGNPSFRKAVYQWVTQGADLSLAHSVIATPGGSGAVSCGFMSFLEPGETIIIPEIGWESYDLMARQNNLKTRTYQLFQEDRLNLESIRQAVLAVQPEQERIVLVINDPCHNPTGYSMTCEEWSELVEFLNGVSQTNPVILINDIAYIDYSYNLKHSREYLNCFNGFSDQVLAVIAFSCSKSFTCYGLRCGAAVILAQQETAVAETASVFEKVARTTWSNIPNAGMQNFTWVVTENRNAYLAEKQRYIDLLKQRSDLFITEARACGLPLYPYKEGFFVTIRVEDNDRVERIQKALMERHIYTVIVNKGIRIAVCSLPLRKTKGLAAVIRSVMDEID